MPTTPIDALHLHAGARPDATAFIHEMWRVTSACLVTLTACFATGMGL
jgi:hypothetical protein